MDSRFQLCLDASTFLGSVRIEQPRLLKGWPGNLNLPIRAMESFEASPAAKRRRLTCRAMPANGVDVKKERGAEQEAGPERPEKGMSKMETDDLWMQLKRQTVDMENHIRRLAGCDGQEGVMAEEPVAASVKATNETGTEREIMPSPADGSNATQSVEVLESKGVRNEEATPGDEKTKTAPVTMAAAEHPFLLAVEQQPAKLARYRLAKQSGVRHIWWDNPAFAWKVRFRKVDSKGGFVSWSTRNFAVKQFMSPGRTGAEADAAALEAAKAFRAELVELAELVKDPDLTSEVPGVSWSKKEEKWRVQIGKSTKFIQGGCFTRRRRLSPRLLSSGRSMACSCR